MVYEDGHKKRCIRNSKRELMLGSPTTKVALRHFFKIKIVTRINSLVARPRIHNYLSLNGRIHQKYDRLHSLFMTLSHLNKARLVVASVLLLN